MIQIFEFYYELFYSRSRIQKFQVVPITFYEQSLGIGIQ